MTSFRYFVFSEREQYVDSVPSAKLVAQMVRSFVVGRVKYVYLLATR